MCYISAMTDPKTVSIVRLTETPKKLSDFAHIKGLLTQEMGLRRNVQGGDWRLQVQQGCDCHN